MTRVVVLPFAIALSLFTTAAKAQDVTPDTARFATADSAQASSAPSPVTPGTGATSGAMTMPAGAPFRPLAAGDVVRLVSTAGRYAGTLASVTADTLIVAAPGRMDAVVRADVSELHRLTGRGSRGRAIARGAGVGVVAGAVLGFLVGTAAGNGECDAGGLECSPGNDGTAQAAFAADGALLGALVGAMLGPSFRRARWERLDAAPLPPPPPAPAASSTAP